VGRVLPHRTPPPLFGADDRSLGIDLVVTRTEDGQRWDGMIFRPGRASRRRRLAVLVVHGSVGNYITGVPQQASFGLANAGFTVMSVNTRMANYGVIFGGGLMHRTPLDIDAALAILRRRGFRRIVLLGFSMGATMVTHYQALRQPLDVVGVCTLAHPASLPSALRLRWNHFGADPGYEEVVERAHLRLAPDYESARNDRIFLVRRGRGFGDGPLDGEIWTYRSWWFSRGPRAPHAESRLRVGGVTVPLALIQAGDDELVLASEGGELETLARQGDCPSVLLHTVLDADHVFTGRYEEMADAVISWLDQRV
jgi:pimeloyl-ACP methyl ester carboxylesterase